MARSADSEGLRMSVPPVQKDGVILGIGRQHHLGEAASIGPPGRPSFPLVQLGLQAQRGEALGHGHTAGAPWNQHSSSGWLPDANIHLSRDFDSWTSVDNRPGFKAASSL